MTLVEQGVKLDDFPMKFETFVLTNSKVRKFSDEALVSENQTISEQLGAHCPLYPPPATTPLGTREIE